MASPGSLRASGPAGSASVHGRAGLRRLEGPDPAGARPRPHTVTPPHPQERWYSSSEHTDDRWPQTVARLPPWEKVAAGAASAQDVQNNKFLMRVNILDNPF